MATDKSVNSSCKPRLIVFDLDYTLWPFWVDTHVDPPFYKDKDGNIYDVRKRKVECYPEVPKALEDLQNEGYELGIASRTDEIKGANQLLKLLDWDKYFCIKEIYPGCKIDHFKKFKMKTGYEFEDMLFFDDEHRNKIDLEKIGVLTIMVDNGVTKDLISKGLLEYKEKYSN